MSNILYGALYGDIAGSTYETKSCKNYSFTTLPEGSHFTDDTVMTLAIAKWILSPKCSQEHLITIMQEMGRKYPKVGYGSSFTKWIFSDTPKAYNSFGNGSAMRVSPCAWLASSLSNAETLALITAEVTHNHPEGIKGAQAVAAAIWMAKEDYGKCEIKDYITKTYGYNLDRTIQEIKDSGYKFDSTCQGSVPEAIIAFLEGTDFDDVIRLAIYLGGDTDTQAAIAGSIAEAYYCLPYNTVDIVDSYLDKDLLKIVKDFNIMCIEDE